MYQLHFFLTVNNAGIAGPSILEATDLDIFRKMFETNFFGVVRLTQEVLPIMKSQRSGRIVNISSIAGFAGNIYDFMLIGLHLFSNAAQFTYQKSLGNKLKSMYLILNEV